MRFINLLHTIVITLLHVCETFTSGYRPESLLIFSITSILSAILVIVSKNPIISVLFLIGLFLSIACYLITLGINFIGISYILVYVGAVSILFLFILMLINVRISELVSSTSNTIPLAIIITLCFSFPIYDILPFNSPLSDNPYFTYISINYYTNYFGQGNCDDYFYSNETAFVTSYIWDGSLAETIDIASIGNIMYTSYSIWLIITSIILLLAMVGSIIITIEQKK